MRLKMFIESVPLVVTRQVLGFANGFLNGLWQELCLPHDIKSYTVLIQEITNAEH